jgi:hypothetical protein
MDGYIDRRQDRWRPATIALAGLVLGVGALGVLLAIVSGRADSAALFVGLPTGLALLLTFTRPARNVHWLTFKAITIGLLLSAVLLHEGAICLIFAAPLVYAIGHGVAALAVSDRRRAGAMVLVPVALVLSLEGLQPHWRAVPTQTVSVTHVVSATPDEVARRVAAGPHMGAAPRPWTLAILPLPGHASGQGDQWRFVFHGDSHGPGGELVTRVSERGDGWITFHPVSDTSVVTRWLDWRDARLAWHPVPGGTEVRLTMSFVRGLDPSWYFGPIEQVLVSSAAGYLLDCMAL